MIKGSQEWYQMVIETINTIYQEELYRAPDVSGLASFIVFAVEGWTDIEIRQAVRTSDEWKIVHAKPVVVVTPVRQFTFEELIKIRGALNIKMNAPYGLRPNQDDNTASLDWGWFYSDDYQSHIIAEYKLRNYTHGPIGPFVDPGYHSLWPSTDIRNENERSIIEAWMLRCNKAGMITPIFVTPDNWTIDQLHTLDYIFKSPLWQDLCQFVVNGFEQMGDKYGWSNKKYCDYATYLKETFPNAKVIALHGCSKLEAPVGDGDDTSKPGMSNADCWRRIASAGFNCFLYQDDMWNGFDKRIDPRGDGRMDVEHFVDLWDKDNRLSFVRRFDGGLWDCNIVPVPAEFGSYGLVWNNESEVKYRDIGRRCIRAGAIGSFDGC